MGLVDGNEEIIDLELAPKKRRKIRIDGDQTRILELDLSDMNIIGRLKTAYKNLQNLSSRVAGLSDNFSEEDSTEETLEKIDSQLSEIDKQMKQEIDTLFDSNVSEVCLPTGTMYDLDNGEFMYERIINSLSKLYENNLNEEFNLMKKRIQKHTDKYTKSKKR